MMRLFFLFVLFLASCSASDRPLLPLTEAPLREELLTIPNSGIVAVKAGDTIYSISNRYRVTPRQIIRLNNLPPPYSLAGVRSLTLPKPRAHIVKAGDSLVSIALRYNVSVDELLQLNNLDETDQLREGMAIVLPRQKASSLPSSGDTGSGAAPKPTPTIKSVVYIPNASNFVWPLDGRIIQPFGVTSRGVHNDGVKIAAQLNAPVRASHGGEVIFVGNGPKALGNLVLLKHDGGWVTVYGHLSDISIAEGDYLAQGDELGRVGQTGRVDSPQLHFEIRQARRPVDPEEFLF